MTVTTEDVSKSYKPASAMSAEAIGFQFLDAADLVVTHIADATGIRTVLVPGTDYVIAGSGMAGTGTITASAAWPDDDILLVERFTPGLQKASLPAHEPIPSVDVERQLDRQALFGQEISARLDDTIARAPLLPLDEDVVGKYPIALPGGGYGWSVGGGADSGVRTDLASYLGAAMTGFLQRGVNAVLRSLFGKVSEMAVSIADYGGVPDVFVDSTAFFNRAKAALGSRGGTIFFPMGDWYLNATVNGDNIRLVGEGGVGDLAGSDNALAVRKPALRPYAVGAGTWTLRISDRSRENRRIKLSNLVISGDRGRGTPGSIDVAEQAQNALWIDGGTYAFTGDNVDFINGMVTLRIQPGDGTVNGYSITGIKFKNCFARNDVAESTSRAIHVIRYIDARGYVTDVHWDGKINRAHSSLGYAVELDGRGSSGLVVHFHNSYLDNKPGFGFLLYGHETIEAFGGLQIDPGAEGTVIVKNMATGNAGLDMTRFMRGWIEGIGGQKIENGDTPTPTQITLPSEPGVVSYMPRLRNAFMQLPFLLVTDPANPYGIAVKVDARSANGPIDWSGAAHHWTDATEAADPTTGTPVAAVSTLGGIATKKKVWAGGAVHSNVGFYVGATRVLTTRQGAVASPTGGATVDSQSRTAIDAIRAVLTAHGLTDA